MLCGLVDFTRYREAVRVTEGPDFLCIGMPKSGTTWLFDQLRHHAGFWIPPVKELHYLESVRPTMQNAVDFLRREQKQKSLARGKHFRRDARDLPFLERAASLSGNPRDLDSYASLFSQKGDGLSGDITPGYGSLQEDMIRDLAARFPRLKIVLLVRDPVERLWSHLCQLHRQEIIGLSVLQNPAELLQFLTIRLAMQRLSFPSEVRLRWETAAPQLPFASFFFDDLLRNPVQLLAQILEFLGAERIQGSRELPVGFNRKEGKHKPPLSDEIQRELVRHFADELRLCARVFGGPAATWAAKYSV